MDFWINYTKIIFFFPESKTVLWWSRRSSVYWLLPQVFSANCMIVKLSITSTYLWLLRGAWLRAGSKFIMFHSYASPFLTLVIIVTNKPIHHWLSVSYLLYHKWLTLSDFVGGSIAGTADVKSWWGKQFHKSCLYQSGKWAWYFSNDEITSSWYFFYFWNDKIISTFSKNCCLWWSI